MKTRLILTLILLAALFAGPAHAQRINQKPPRQATPASGEISSRIVAVVNDNVISTSDVDARMAMAFLSSGLPDTPEVRARLFAQILRIMVDEQLQLQEAKKLDITVSPEEINQAMTRIAQGNNIPGGDMREFLSSRGIPPEALAGQIRAGLAWNKVIQRELRPRVDVGDDEVEAVLERNKANAGKEEFLVSEIFLPVDSPKEEEQVKQFAQSLVSKLRQGGNFGAMARQFSQNASAASGGDAGWISEGVFAPELNRALVKLKPGEITEPVRSAAGYHILGVRERRTISPHANAAEATFVRMQQVFRPFGSAGDKTAALKEAESLRASIKSCENLKSKVARQFPAWKWQDLGAVKLSTTPKWLVSEATHLPVGTPSKAMEVDNGALILFVCDRKEPGSRADHDAVVEQIGTEKLELQARGLLRDLRRNAYLDIRAGTH